MQSFDYSSTQVNLPKLEAAKFLTFGKDIVKPSVVYKPGEYGYCDIPHVTVLYGLQDDHPSVELIDFIKGYPKFTVTLGKVSLFKNEDFDVVKVDVKCPDLHVLNAEIKKIAPNTQTFPNYVPHSTVAYVNCDSCDHLEGIDTISGLSFVPDTICFSNVAGRRIHLPIGRK